MACEYGKWCIDATKPGWLAACFFDHVLAYMINQNVSDFDVNSTLKAVELLWFFIYIIPKVSVIFANQDKSEVAPVYNNSDIRHQEIYTTF